jgi:hypothetical protein
MSIVEVVEHLYHIEKTPDCLTITFLTSRKPWYMPFLAFSGLCGGVLWSAFRFRWTSPVISGVVGGSVGLVATAFGMIAEHLTRYIIAIEPDIISFQRECAGVPIGRARIFPRSAVTDLGVYPRTYHGRSRPLPRLGRLSVWVNGKSIEIESFFPIREGLALARDLREAGIVLSRTHEEYSEDRLSQVDDYGYLTF